MLEFFKKPFSEIKNLMIIGALKSWILKRKKKVCPMLMEYFLRLGYPHYNGAINSSQKL